MSRCVTSRPPTGDSRRAGRRRAPRRRCCGPHDRWRHRPDRAVPGPGRPPDTRDPGREARRRSVDDASAATAARELEEETGPTGRRISSTSRTSSRSVGFCDERIGDLPRHGPPHQVSVVPGRSRRGGCNGGDDAIRQTRCRWSSTEGSRMRRRSWGSSSAAHRGTT